MGDWEPTPEFFERLLAPDAGDADVSRPYPFFLAYALERAAGRARRPSPTGRPSGSGTASAAQLIRRAGRTFLWSRGEELVTDRYPELADARRRSCPTAP